MRWLSGMFVRLRRDRESRRAAKRLSRERYEHDRIHSTRIVERNDDDLTVAIEYYGVIIPMRCRFFRVALATMEAEEYPPEFLPRGWTPRR